LWSFFSNVESEKSASILSIFTNLMGVVIGLGTAVFLLILIGFFQNRKKNKLLQGQNEEIQKQSSAIQVQNEELYQQQEEILAQRGYIEEKNKQLDYQNLKMSKSIEAALVIQQSLLPTENTFKQIFREHFVIFYPKDIVSGDCYMLEKIDNKIFLIVVDCTGHGVAGAFMSLIANNVLEKILYAKHIYSPAEILEHLDQDVQIALKKEETGNLYGMDCAVVCLEYLNEHQAQLTYAGAKRNMYYKRFDTNELREIPAERRAIGSKQLGRNRCEFNNHSLLLEKGTVIYLSTDGFADQCDVNRRNLGGSNFRKMLNEYLSLPLNQQKIAFEQTFANYMQGADQRDDVTLIGIKI
jgi:serine phosphatase RsbU (regulator of sigma subunit)